MQRFDKIKYLKSILFDGSRIWTILHDRKYEKNRIQAEIIRYTHSIEKGLSLANPRLGFGYANICELNEYIKRYISLGGLYTDEVVYMACDALSEYLIYHEKKQFGNTNIKNIALIYKEISSHITSKDKCYGGVLDLQNTYTAEREDAFRSLVNSRHSVREFKDTDVPLEKILDAVKLAERCPSACNRQGYHAYIIPKSIFKKLDGWLDGVGGFAQDADKMILITGKISAYRVTEKYQWVVSATVFASNLILSLHAKGLGACYIQRAVTPNLKWDTVSEKLEIPSDEQAVCMIAVGELKDRFKAPVSYRFDVDSIYTLCK